MPDTHTFCRGWCHCMHHDACPGCLLEVGRVKDLAGLTIQSPWRRGVRCDEQHVTVYRDSRRSLASIQVSQFSFLDQAMKDKTEFRGYDQDVIRARWPESEMPGERMKGTQTKVGKVRY